MEVKNLSPTEFVSEILKKRLNAELCVCGYNYTFGRGGMGDPKLLKELCSENGIEVLTVDRVTLENEDVSSSAIRRKLTDGDMESANKLLGRPYFLIDTVKKGAQKGRTVGMPTVNFGCFVLCRNVYIPRREPILPPIAATPMRVASGMRQRLRRAFSLSVSIRRKPTALIINR